MMKSIKFNPSIPSDIFDLIIERSTSPKPLAKSAVGKLLADNSNNILRYSGLKRGAIRLMAIDHTSMVTDDQIQSIFKSSDFNIVKILPPKQGLSSKYDTYTITNSDHHIYDVIVGIGRNKGQAYEDELNTELNAIVNGNSISDRVKLLLKRLKINPANVAEIKQDSNKRVKRPLTGKLVNVGKEISDITIVLMNGDEIYISLKANSGRTFANAGYKGGFIVIPSRNNVKVVPNEHPLDEFIEALGVDKSLAAEGYTLYANARLKNLKKTTLNKHNISDKQNFEIVSRYLQSAFGYGYWYVREQGSDFDVKNLNRKQSVKNVVGEIIGIEVRYPGKSKQITAKIETTSNVFEVEVRNSQGMLDPNEIKVRIK